MLNVPGPCTSIKKGMGTCTQVDDHRATREELEASIKQVGLLGELTQTVAKDYFFVVKGIKGANLADSLAAKSGRPCKRTSSRTVLKAN